MYIVNTFYGTFSPYPILLSLLVLTTLNRHPTFLPKTDPGYSFEILFHTYYLVVINPFRGSVSHVVPSEHILPFNNRLLGSFVGVSMSPRPVSVFGTVVLDVSDLLSGTTYVISSVNLRRDPDTRADFTSTLRRFCHCL